MSDPRGLGATSSRSAHRLGLDVERHRRGRPPRTSRRASAGRRARRGRRPSRCAVVRASSMRGSSRTCRRYSGALLGLAGAPRCRCAPVTRRPPESCRGKLFSGVCRQGRRGDPCAARTYWAVRPWSSASPPSAATQTSPRRRPCPRRRRPPGSRPSARHGAPFRAPADDVTCPFRRAQPGLPSGPGPSSTRTTISPVPAPATASPWSPRSITSTPGSGRPTHPDGSPAGPASTAPVSEEP